MPHSSKRKGNEYEREIVNDAEEVGLSAERAYASDGRALGEAKECDVLIDNRWRIQAKRRKNIAQYIQPPEGTDAVMVREDRGETLVIIPKDLFYSFITTKIEDGDATVKELFKKLLNKIDD